jgi:hypothetical protein|tara:strand:- start:741 stop:917 length:177 start_codon:yes stop_codon:yes gene_type:complete
MDKPKIEPKDFYWENGRMVMTENFHKRRGSCCGGGCKHCPFWPLHIKLNKVIRDDIRP